MNKAELAGAVTGMVLALVLVSLVLALIFAWPIMWLWNATLPALLGVSAITYWQAVGIKFLLVLLLPIDIRSVAK